VTTTGEPLLSYELVTWFPTRRGNVRVVVDRSGAVRTQRNDRDPPPDEEWAGPLPNDPRSVLKDAESRLAKALDRGGFFAMDSQYVSDTTTDGTRQVLTWNGARGPKSVTVDRARVPAFEKLLGELWRLLGLAGVV
jgi:hypothetical protein